MSFVEFPQLLATANRLNHGKTEIGHINHTAQLVMRQNTKNVQNQNLRTEHEKKKFSEPEQPEPEPEHQPKNR